MSGAYFLWSERRGCLGFASRSQSFAFCASHKPALSVRSPDSLTLFTPSVRKSARTLFEFSPLSLYILKNTLSGVILKMERETRLELATPSLARKCSTTELLSHSVIIIIHGKFYFSTILFCFLQIQSHRLF